MELQFTLTPEHTQLRVQAALNREMHKRDEVLARLQGPVARVQERILLPLLLIIFVIAGLLVITSPEQAIPPGKTIPLALSGIAFILFWWFGAGPLRRYLRTRFAPKQDGNAQLRTFEQRLLEAKLRTTLKASEGTYYLRFDDEGFTLNRAKGAEDTLAWHEIVRFTETADFYGVAGAKQDRLGKAYCIPRHSDAMDTQQYQQGLAQFLSHIPDVAK